MAPETVRALRAINERFYRTHAAGFAAKREHPWAGMRRLFEELPGTPEDVLDCGCGHGRFGALLAEHNPAARYTGIDASADLLALARERADLPVQSGFARVDLLDDPVPLPAARFDLVTLFGVIHHVPGEGRRRALIGALADAVAPGGCLTVAFWSLRAEPNARKRLPWSAVGLTPDDVDPGDHLMAFDGDDGLLRYAHFASDAELDRLVADCALPLRSRYEADGSGGAANTYLVWERR